jgi:VWFA-related protein
LKLSTQLVVVDAQVIGKSGSPVNGLTQRDFVLYEEGVKQQITHFSQDRLPLSIVLLLDVSGSVMPVTDQVRESGLKALNELKPGDEVALMAFGVWATVLQDFTRDRQLIAAGVAFIESMGPWIRGGTHIEEAVYEAAKYLSMASNPGSRRIIVIVTDNLSNQPSNVGHSEAEALRQLHASGAAVCGLVVGDFKAAVNEYRRRGFLLRDSIGNFLTETGGILSQVDKDDVTAKLARLIERLRSRYSLGYTPLDIKADGKFRNIKLTVVPEVEQREGRVTIVARKGYYAPGRN